MPLSMFSESSLPGPATIDVTEGDWVDLIESCVEAGEEGKVVELKKAAGF